MQVIGKTFKFASQHRGVMNIEKQLDLAPDLPPVYADGKQMQQVFLNIILNAFQAMSGGGHTHYYHQLASRQDREYVQD